MQPEAPHASPQTLEDAAKAYTPAKHGQSFYSALALVGITAILAATGIACAAKPSEATAQTNGNRQTIEAIAATPTPPVWTPTPTYTPAPEPTDTPTPDPTIYVPSIATHMPDPLGIGILYENNTRLTTFQQVEVPLKYLERRLLGTDTINEKTLRFVDEERFKARQLELVGRVLYNPQNQPSFFYLPTGGTISDAEINIVSDRPFMEIFRFILNELLKPQAAINNPDELIFEAAGMVGERASIIALEELGYDFYKVGYTPQNASLMRTLTRTAFSRRGNLQNDVYNNAYLIAWVGGASQETGLLAVLLERQNGELRVEEEMTLYQHLIRQNRSELLEKINGGFLPDANLATDIVTRRLVPGKQSTPYDRAIIRTYQSRAP